MNSDHSFCSTKTYELCLCYGDEARSE